MSTNVGRHTRGMRPAKSPKAAAIYVALVNVVGLAALGYCAVQFAARPEPDWFWLAALTVITSSLAIAVPIPGGRAGGLAITVSDCFVLMALLLHGPAAAALTAAIDATVTGVRCRIKRRERFAFNVAVLTLTAYLVASLFNLMSGASPPVTTLLSGGVLPALGISVLAYFVFNSAAVALGMSLHSGQSFGQIWKTNFPWASPTVLANTLAALFFILGIHQPATSAMALFLGLGLVCLAFSSAYLVKGRRWALNGRAVKSG